MTRRQSLWLYGSLILLNLLAIFGGTLYGRYLTCRISLEFNPNTLSLSHEAIKEECKERIDPFLLLRR